MDKDELQGNTGSSSSSPSDTETIRTQMEAGPTLANRTLSTLDATIAAQVHILHADTNVEHEMVPSKPSVETNTTADQSFGAGARPADLIALPARVGTSLTVSKEGGASMTTPKDMNSLGENDLKLRLWPEIGPMDVAITPTCICMSDYGEYIAASSGASSSQEEPAKFFIGEILERGRNVEGVAIGQLVCGLYDGSDIHYNSEGIRLVVQFNSIVCAPESLKAEAVNFMASFQSLFYGLHCISHFVHLQPHESIAICAYALEDTFPILQWILSLDVIVFVCAIEIEDSLIESAAELHKKHSFFQHGSNYGKSEKLRLCRMHRQFGDDILRQTFGMGVSTVLVLPSAEKGQKWKMEELVRESLAGAGLLGRLVFTSPPDQFDDISCKVMYGKALSISCYNSQTLLSARHQLGVILHMIREILDSLAQAKVWTPNISYRTFSIKEVEEAREYAGTHKDELIMCCKMATH